MELVIEVVTRSGKVLSLHPVSGERIRIGRGYDNHLILQEEHVCPFHAELVIDDSGELVLVDHSEVNGVKDKHNQPLPERVRVNSGDVFTIGKHHVRILKPDHPVAEAKRINVFEDMARALNHWYLALALAIVFGLWNLVDTYFSAFQEVTWSQMAVKSIFITLGVAVIPIVVALLARVFRKEVKFFTIVVFCFAMFLIWQSIHMLGSFLQFNWGSSQFVGLLGQLLRYLLLGLFLWGCFYLASTMSLKKISIVTTALVLVVAGLAYIHDKGNDKVVLSPQFAAKVLPSNLLFANPVDVEQYIALSNSLFEQAAKEAERRNKEADEQ